MSGSARFFDRWNRTMQDSPLMVFNLGTLKPKNADDQYYWGMVFNGTDTDVSGGVDTNRRYKALTEAAAAVRDGDPIVAAD